MEAGNPHPEHSGLSARPSLWIMLKPVLLLSAALWSAPLAAGDTGFFVTAGCSTAGITLGADYRPFEYLQLGTRVAYFPGVEAADLHGYWIANRSRIPVLYSGPELIYLHDTVVLTDRIFTSYEWVALQYIFGLMFPLASHLSLGIDGGMGLRLYDRTTTVAGGPSVPIDFPVSGILRVELAWGPWAHSVP
jgi:hypothetical protein